MEVVKTGLAVVGALVIFGSASTVAYFGIAIYNFRRLEKERLAKDAQVLADLNAIWEKSKNV